VAAFSQLASLSAFVLLGPALGLFDFSPEVSRLLMGYLSVRLLAAGAVVGTEALPTIAAGWATPDCRWWWRWA
jgi:hypothetical protein